MRGYPSRLPYFLEQSRIRYILEPCDGAEKMISSFWSPLHRNGMSTVMPNTVIRELSNGIVRMETRTNRGSLLRTLIRKIRAAKNRTDW